MDDLYSDRKLTEGYPDLESSAVDWFSENQSCSSNVEDVLRQIDRMIDLANGSRRVLVVGCGPKPATVVKLLAMGYEAHGVEPVPGLAKAAATFIDDPKRISIGQAESLPAANESQQVVLLESVLEHVDSPTQALAEAYRVLEPGGVLYIYTTNRFRVSLRGYNGEFHIPFCNWFPRLVQESMVFKHLHYAPKLANYSLRPAVHWFSYSNLCRRGREVGFAQFYSKLDSLATIPARGWKQRLAKLASRSILLRSLVLLQYGNSIYMWKRATGDQASYASMAPTAHCESLIAAGDATMG